MTEEQRMEEGRRMFQIFAARMFEQRVLTAYREKVAKEKAEMLLQEQEEEERRAEERKAKKARDAQKKKAKKDIQKLAKAEEKAKKEAEKAQEEAAAKAAEEKKQDEQRKKKEEQRKKKEAERKAQEGEKQRKEAERLKRQQEERERQQEAERKAREQKAEKKAKEEARRKQREEQEAKERDAKEREAKERKAQEEKERKERDARLRADKEAAAAASAAAAVPMITSKPAQPQAPTFQKRPSQQTSIAGPPGLRGSPQIAPALPKAPTPAGRQRQASQPVSHGSSPGNPSLGPLNAGGPPRLGSPIRTGSQPANASIQPTVMPKTILTKQSSGTGTGPLSSRTQPNSPIHPLSHDPTHGSPFGQPFPMSPFGSHPPGMPNVNQRPPVAHPQQHIQQPFPQQPGSFQPFPLGSGSLRGHPPGMGAPGLPPFGRGPPLDTPPGLGQPMTGFPNQFPPPTSATAPIGPPGHSRTSSASIDKSPLDGGNAFAPGHRPGPVQRPSSTKPHDLDRHLSQYFDEHIEEMAQKMGSASLGGDEDDSLNLTNLDARSTSGLPFGGPLPPNHPPGGGFGGMPPLVGAPSTHSFASLNGLPSISGATNNWQHPAPGFPPHSAATTPSWASSPNPNNLWSTNPPTNSGPPSSAAFGAPPLQNPRDRLRQLRLSLCRICRALDVTASTSPATLGDSHFHDLADILAGLNAGIPPHAHVSRAEVVEILDTLGDAHNGGGNFHTRAADGDRVLVKYENELPLHHPGGVGGAAPGAHHSVVGGQVVGGPSSGAGLGPIASPVQQSSGLAGRPPFAPIGSQGY